MITYRFMTRLIFSNENLPIKILKSALYGSVSVLSTKVQRDNCILRSILETGLPFYVVVVRATQRTSHSQSKGKTFISQYLVDPVSIPRGRNRDTLALLSSALLTELVLLRCFRLSTSKREFSTRTPKIL